MSPAERSAPNGRPAGVASTKPSAITPTKSGSPWDAGAEDDDDLDALFQEDALESPQGGSAADPMPAVIQEEQLPAPAPARPEERESLQLEVEEKAGDTAARIDSPQPGAADTPPSPLAAGPESVQPAAQQSVAESHAPAVSAASIEQAFEEGKEEALEQAREYILRIRQAATEKITELETQLTSKDQQLSQMQESSLQLQSGLNSLASTHAQLRQENEQLVTSNTELKQKLESLGNHAQKVIHLETENDKLRKVCFFFPFGHTSVGALLHFTSALHTNHRISYLLIGWSLLHSSSIKNGFVESIHPFFILDLMS